MDNQVDKVEQTEVKDEIQALAEELGLDVKALTGEDEVKMVEEEKEPKRERKRSKKTEKPEPKPRKNKDSNEKVREINGIPVNHLARPIAVTDGKPQELKVTFSQEEAEQYRKNGRILLTIEKGAVRKKGGDTLKVTAEYADGRKEEIVVTNNHNRGLKRAKTWAMLLKLAFDPKKDVVVVSKAKSPVA